MFSDPQEVPPEAGGLFGVRMDLVEEWLTTKLGIVVTEWDPSRVVGTMPVKGNIQAYGLLHGGASATLAESLGSIGAALNAGPGRISVGIELSCTHHRAATTGLVTGVCVPLHVGRTVSTFEIVVSDEDGRRICTSRLTCMNRDRPPATD